MRNERFVSVYLALFLSALVAATWWNGHQYFVIFADFKVAISPLTLLSLQLTTGNAAFLFLGLLPLIWALAIGNLASRWIGLVVVLGFGILNWGLLMPYIALIQGLSGSEAENAPSVAFSIPLFSPAALVLVWNFVVGCAFALSSLRLWRVTNWP